MQALRHYCNAQYLCRQDCGRGRFVWHVYYTSLALERETEEFVQAVERFGPIHGKPFNTSAINELAAKMSPRGDSHIKYLFMLGFIMRLIYGIKACC